jgi:F0F1-type ATP synthase assembly protein I
MDDLPAAPRANSGLASFLEREAGHVVVSLLLIFIGAALWYVKVPKAEDLIPFATGVLARSMIGSSSKQQGQQ